MGHHPGSPGRLSARSDKSAPAGRPPRVHQAVQCPRVVSAPPHPALICPEDALPGQTTETPIYTHWLV